MNKVNAKLFLAGLILILSGCSSQQSGNVGQLQSYAFSPKEADWILGGEPIEYENELWYPQDGTENLQDSEVYLLGEYRGVQLFVDKLDVRPYNRIYTKFNRNQYRYFEKRKSE